MQLPHENPDFSGIPPFGNVYGYADSNPVTGPMSNSFAFLPNALGNPHRYGNIKGDGNVKRGFQTQGELMKPAHMPTKSEPAREERQRATFNPTGSRNQGGSKL